MHSVFCAASTQFLVHAQSSFDVILSILIAPLVPFLSSVSKLILYTYILDFSFSPSKHPVYYLCCMCDDADIII